jgi:prephenate dehydrogenase
MNKFAIGIVGGTGGIGKWFAAFFAAEGYPVHVTGRSTGMPLPELAGACRIVIVAVPMASTIGVIREVGPLLPEETLLMDLTSLKAEPVRAMLADSRAEVIGCHPLFGPDAPSLAGQNIVLCPARGGRWLDFLQRTFVKNGARITVTAPAEHDRMMALIQGLTHLDTILMGLTLQDSPPSQRRSSGQSRRSSRRSSARDPAFMRLSSRKTRTCRRSLKSSKGTSSL